MTTPSRYDGCYNCAKRDGNVCPKFPRGIKGDGPCEDHELMTSFQYGREAEKTYMEGEKNVKGRKEA